MLWEKRNRALLIQLLATELIAAFQSLSRNASTEEILSLEKRFFPYDWAYPYGYLNKVREHAQLLACVFPELAAEAIHLQKLIDKAIRSCSKTLSTVKQKMQKQLAEMWFALEPFMEKYKDDENLVLFLLKNMQEIDLLAQRSYLHGFLLKLHPLGLAELCEKLCDNYHHRGFYFLIPEIKLLLTKLEHAL
jgi:hypothetical protein